MNWLTLAFTLSVAFATWTYNFQAAGDTISPAEGGSPVPSFTLGSPLSLRSRNFKTAGRYSDRNRICSPRFPYSYRTALSVRPTQLRLLSLFLVLYCARPCCRIKPNQAPDGEFCTNLHYLRAYLLALRLHLKLAYRHS